MKTLRRWTTTIVTSFDRMISQVENHEAMVNAAIREVQESGGRARVQLGRVKQDGERMRRKLIELRNALSSWEERAVKTAAVDEDRALECLKRRRRVAKEIGELEEQERAHAKLERQLVGDLQIIEEKLQTLKTKRNVLRTRESRAEALKALSNDGSYIISELDDIFDRWEVKVAEYEFGNLSTESVQDDLEAQYVSEEGQEALKAELHSLVAAERPSNKNLANIND